MNRIMMILKKSAIYGEQALAYLKARTKRLHVLILLGLAVLIGVASFFVTQTTNASRDYAEFRLALLATPFPDNPAIMELQADLQNNSLSKPAQSSVLEKLAMAERMAAEQAVGASQAQRLKEPPELPPSASLVMNALDVPEGIYEGSQGFFRPSFAEISNCWQGVYDGKVVQIFAGSQPDQGASGMLIIFQEDPKLMKRTMTILPAPTDTGLLRIASVKDGKITLQTADKSKLYFNLETMEFLK